MIVLLPANLDKSKGCIARYYIKQNVRCISWREFVQKNRLKKGDLCLFELRKKEIRGKLVLTMLVHFETESEQSNDSSVRVHAASHHEVKKEVISLSSGSDSESSSDISYGAAERVCYKWKRRGTFFFILFRFELLILILYASRCKLVFRYSRCIVSTTKINISN
jgi:hypothetical protein